MTENLWKKPKEIEGELQWKQGLSWRDIYFQVVGDTIYLYSNRRRGDNRILHSICLTQVDEISEIGTNTGISKRCFKIILKMGAIEQFKCPAKMERLNIQQWIANLRHAQKFWTDKENLKQRKPGSQRRITLERPDKASKSLDTTKRRVFFTLWNGEMIGLLVNTTSTFTSVYSRLFSFACESRTCSVCKIRHQSCDLWAVDTTGTARRVRKDETLTDLDKEGNCLFVMEHHQKLLVVFFSDFSYETLPVPAGITAKQVLKLDQIASKLNELSCFDPGLFLRHENGKEVQFCMNDNPFSYHDYGKIVARSKRVRLNSLKKSDHKVIADIRRKEFEERIKRQQTSNAVNELLANKIRKTSRMDEELCFVDDHFALDNDGDHLKTRSDTLSVSTCSELPDYELISVTKDEETFTQSQDSNCAKNRSDVINSTVEVTTGNSQYCSRNYGDTIREGSLDSNNAENNNDVRNTWDSNFIQSNTNQTLYNDACSKSNNDTVIVSASDDEHVVEAPDHGDIINMPDTCPENANFDTSQGNHGINNDDVINTFNGSGNENDIPPKLSNQLVESGNIDINTTSTTEPNAEHTNVSCPSNTVPLLNQYPAINTNFNPEPNPNLSPNYVPESYPNIIPKHETSASPDPIQDQKRKPNHDHVSEMNPDPIRDDTTSSDHTIITSPGPIPEHKANIDPVPEHKMSPDSIPDHKPDPIPDHKINPDSISDHNTSPDAVSNCTTNLHSRPGRTTNQTALSKPQGKKLISSQSDGMVFREQRNEDIAFSQPPVNRTGMRRSLSDLNVRYSFISNETRDSAVESRDTRAMSEPDLLEKDDILRVDEVFPPKESPGGFDDEEICKQSELSTFTGPTWTFAKRVEECVRKILNVKSDIPQVEKLIREELCKVLLELLNHGLKKKIWAVSLFSIGSNVWDVCQTVSKATNVGVNVIARVKGGTIDQRFHIFIRECIRHKILNQWFEVLSSEKVQKQIMKYYEPNAVVLEPEHSKAMEHLKLYLDALDVLKLKGLKARESNESSTFLISFE